MKTNEKMKKGDFRYKTKSGVSAYKWMDNKAVTFLSTLHSPKTITSVNRKNKDGSLSQVTCPEVVKVYNNIMGGVDRFDQFRERYAIGRRSVKWWHRILYFLIDLAIVSSFILWNVAKGTKIDQLSFRLRLAKQLIGNYTFRKRRGRKVSALYLSKKGKVPDDVRLVSVGEHMPKETTWRRCRFCSTGASQRRTRFECSKCKVPLCTGCFEKFHNKLKKCKIVSKYHISNNFS